MLPILFCREEGGIPQEPYVYTCHSYLQSCYTLIMLPIKMAVNFGVQTSHIIHTHVTFTHSLTQDLSSQFPCHLESGCLACGTEASSRRNHHKFKLQTSPPTLRGRLLYLCLGTLGGCKKRTNDFFIGRLSSVPPLRLRTYLPPRTAKRPRRPPFFTIETTRGRCIAVLFRCQL